jgi:hypothetical protein
MPQSKQEKRGKALARFRQYLADAERSLANIVNRLAELRKQKKLAEANAYELKHAPEMERLEKKIVQHKLHVDFTALAYDRNRS